MNNSAISANKISELERYKKLRDLYAQLHKELESMESEGHGLIKEIHQVADRQKIHHVLEYIDKKINSHV